MDLYPAVDIRDGRAVRLVQGDFARQHVYGDPVALARRFAAAGARWLHVVDLDAARTGQPVNRSVVLEIAAAVDVPVQCGGGVRTAADVDQLVGGGVARVVLGTAATDDMAGVARLARAHPGQVAVGLDYRVGADGQTEVAVRGWEQGTGRTLAAMVEELAGSGAAAVIATAIDRDGTLGGPDLGGLSGLLAATDLPVVASGGVGGVEDVLALAALSAAAGPSGGGPAARPVPARPRRRLAGVVVGKAIVDGRMTVEEGVAACAPSG